MSEHSSLDSESLSQLSLAIGAPDSTTDERAPHFDVPLVSFYFPVAPAPPYDEFKQAGFLGSDADNLDCVEDASAPQRACGRTTRFKSDIYRVRNGAEISSTSIPSINTVIEADIVMHLSHERLCTFIDAHQSMQGAEIVRSCTFVEKKKRLTPHRCLLLELDRPGRKNMWVRLERKPTSGAALVFGKGKTPSNDVVNTTISAADSMLSNILPLSKVFSCYW